MKQGINKKLITTLLCVALTVVFGVGCSNNKEQPDPAISVIENSVESATPAPEPAPETPVNSAMPETINPIESATIEQVQNYMNDSDENTILVDARSQEAYSGWALEGAANGGHLNNAVLFSARWLDCEYSGSAPRTAYLERAMKDQNITADKNVIVYDYTGEQAIIVANYLKNQGINNISIFQANELINEGTGLNAYMNYDRFIPTEIVKSISDVITGKATSLSDDAKSVIGDDLNKVILVDVGWGNAKDSSYFTVGHVPGAIHINTDSYERPRVYVPEKRSDYAKEWRLISLEEFRDEVCPQYGITKDSIVILTTGSSTAPQGRLGYMLRSLGVKVYAMSGNLTAWKYNGYDLDTDFRTLVTPVSVSSFGSDTIANPDEILWTDDIKAILNGDVVGQVADNRVEEEWKGEHSGYSYHDLAGRIDGTIWCLQGNDEQGDFFENIDYTPRTQAEMTAYLESNGLDVTKPIAFFCGDSWGAAKIAYWCQAVDLNTVKQWGSGWIPWSNEGNEFIDHNGRKVHYDKYLDAILDKDGNDVSDGINIKEDATKQ